MQKYIQMFSEVNVVMVERKMFIQFKEENDSVILC